MGIIPIVTPKQLLRILLRAGFKMLRQKGSHIRVMHPVTRRFTTVPMHVRDLTRGTLLGILKQAGISVQQFLRLLRK